MWRSTIFINVYKRTLYSNVTRRTISNDISRFWDKYRRPIILFTTVSGGIILYSNNETVYETARYAWFSTKRITTVSQATIRCLYHYKRALNSNIEDDELREIELNRCHKRCALITLHALSSNGGVFIKIGQHIGAMTYLLPKEWTETMIPLQDQCPESTFEDIEEMFEDEMGSPMNDLFESIDMVPIGVASLAQVYKGKWKGTGELVAIKCQHPELKDYIPIDVWLTKKVFGVLDYVFPEYPLMWLHDELRSSIYNELDFEQEAENSIQAAKHFQDLTSLTALRIPNVVKATHRVLIMEYIEGRRLDDLEYIDSHNISRSEVSYCLSHIFNKMIFTPNMGLHCDPHGGNLAIRYIEPEKGKKKHNFEIILYDHGLYRYPDIELRRNYAKFWLSVLNQDQEAMKYYAIKFAHINENEFPLFAAALTGRSIDFVMKYDITKRRSEEEIRSMKDRILLGNMIADIMAILSKIPRIVLLILKTNDLTRYLDESLQNPLGPERTFLIMSQYCAELIYAEDKEKLNQEYSESKLYYNSKIVNWFISYLKIWYKYEKIKNKLIIYDSLIWFRDKLNLFKIIF